MFSGRCYGLPGCGHNTNWTCPCTCDEIAREPEGRRGTEPEGRHDVAEHLKRQIEGLLRFVQHDQSCGANDLDYLDSSPCTCGLRRFYNPKGAALAPPPQAQVE